MSEKRELVDYIREIYSLSIRACYRVHDFSHSVYHYAPDPNRDREVIEKLNELVERYPRYGFPKLFAVLKREGYNWNHKRIHRVYCKMGLNN